MNPREISRHLPNGFHGAIVERISVDYIARKAEFTLKLLVPDEKNVAGRSRLRVSKFEVNSLAVFSLEVPDPHYNYASDQGLEIGGLLDTTAKISPSFPAFQRELGPSFFFHSFFVEEWNGFIHFSGKEARFDWIES